MTSTNERKGTKMTRKGWLVIEDTRRDGCDVTDGTQQYWRKRDAEQEAERLRREHADDPYYTVSVERES